MNKCLPSQNPPGGLEIKKMPQFIAIGFDDNDKSGFTSEKGLEGMKWAVDTFLNRKNPDGSTCSCAFYMLSRYVTEEEALELPHFVKKSWKYAYDNGFEIGCHTHNHHDGANFTTQQWLDEMNRCIDILTKPYLEGDDSNATGIGISRNDIISFRAPYLAYNDNTFKAIEKMGFVYDSSLEEGYQDDQDGHDFYFPYTLDEGAPGNRFINEDSGRRELIKSHPGIWEMPVQVVVVPPDELCESYGIPKGLRKKCASVQHYFSETGGKVCGLDYNCLAEMQMTGAEFLATLKYSLDLRLESNRAPFIFGTHTGIYALEYDSNPVIQISIRERQKAIEDFLDYALSKPEVYVVSPRKVVEWMQKAL